MARIGRKKAGLVCGSTPKKPGALTPTTVNGRLLSRIDCPITDGLPLKRRCQYAYASTTTGGEPERSSALPNKRPPAAGTPRALKGFAEAKPPGLASASPPATPLQFYPYVS